MSQDIKKMEDLYAEHAEYICDDRLEEWTELFADDCVYRIISRVNHERKLPLNILLAESKGALIDRVTAIRNTMVYLPRYVTHMTSNMRITQSNSDLLASRSHIAVYQTLIEGSARIHLVGRTFDQIDTSEARWKFVSRVVVFDNELIAGSVVYPV